MCLTEAAEALLQASATSAARGVYWICAMTLALFSNVSRSHRDVNECCPSSVICVARSSETPLLASSLEISEQ